MSKKVVFSAVAVTVALLVAEGALRLCGYRPKPPDEPPPIARPQQENLDSFEHFTICDRKLGFRNRRNGRYRVPYIVGYPISTTDAYGYRNGHAWDPEGDSPIVAFVGDSITFCAEVNDDETGPSEVAKLLRKRFDVRVLNAGVRGFNTLQAKCMLAEVLQRFPQIKIAVYTHCGNDIEETMVPNLRFPTKAPVMLRDPKTGEFREVEVTDPVVAWGESFVHFKPKRNTRSTIGIAVEALQRRSALCRYSLAGLRRAYSELFSRYRFPEEGEVVPAYEYGKWHHWALLNGGNRVMQRLLAEMNEICKSHGAVFVVTDYLTGLDGYTSAAFAANCLAAGVRFVSIDDTFRHATTACICKRLDGQFDEHYSAVGTKMYAAGLVPALEKILQEEFSLPSI